MMKGWCDMTDEPLSTTNEPDEAQGGEGKAKPIRFQFGPDTSDEDIERFLDRILGPKSEGDES
jgi:hypothetical protein